MWSLPVLRRRSMRRKREKKTRERNRRSLSTNTRFDVLVSMDLCTEKRGLCVSVWILKERKEGRRTREKYRENVAGRLLNGRFMCFCAYATRVCVCVSMCVRVCTYNIFSSRTTTYEWWWRATTFFSFRPPACHWLKSLFRRQQHLVYW